MEELWVVIITIRIRSRDINPELRRKIRRVCASSTYRKAFPGLPAKLVSNFPVTGTFEEALSTDFNKGTLLGVCKDCFTCELG